MIRKLYILTALFAATLLASCGKDAPAEPGGDDGTKTTLTFRYDVPAAPTRSTTVPAGELEKAVYDMDIFAYQENGAFVARLTEGTDYEETVSGTTATVNMTIDFLMPNAGRTLVFYFVANNASSKGGTHTGGIDYENMTARQFENALCAPLPDLGGGQVNGLVDLAWDWIPDSGGKPWGLLMTAKSEPVRLAGRQQEKVTLVRRTARFDLRNDFKDTYEISEIYISGAQVHGQLFGTGQQQTLLPAKPYLTMQGPYDDEFDPNNEYPGWFYLYPTTLGEGATEITILVTRLADSATALIKVDGTTEVKANYRYTLVFNAVNLTFTLTNGQGDWGEGGNG